MFDPKTGCAGEGKVVKVVVPVEASWHIEPDDDAKGTLPEELAVIPKENSVDGDAKGIEPKVALKEGDDKDEKVVVQMLAGEAWERELLNKLEEAPEEEDRHEFELNGLAPDVAKPNCELQVADNEEPIPNVTCESKAPNWNTELFKKLLFLFPEKVAGVPEDNAAVAPKDGKLDPPDECEVTLNIPFSDIGKMDEVDKEPVPSATGYKDENTGLDTPTPWLEDAATPVKE